MDKKSLTEARIRPFTRCRTLQNQMPPLKQSSRLGATLLVLHRTEDMARLLHSLFVPAGEMSEALYWKASVGLLGGLTAFSVVGFSTLPDPVLLMMLTAYPVICLTARRLRRAGRKGRMALLPFGAGLAHCLAVGVFSVLTLGGTGAGSGGGPVSRQIYRALEDLGEPHIYMLLFLGWIVWVGCLPPGRDRGETRRKDLLDEKRC